MDCWCYVLANKMVWSHRSAILALHRNEWNSTVFQLNVSRTKLHVFKYFCCYSGYNIIPIFKKVYFKEFFTYIFFYFCLEHIKVCMCLFKSDNARCLEDILARVCLGPANRANISTKHRLQGYYQFYTTGYQYIQKWLTYIH